MSYVAFTLEENLVLTNKELLANRTRLASLIKSFEKSPWNSAQKKAKELLEQDKAEEYIERVRGLVKNGILSEHVSTLADFEVEKKPANVLTVYEKNYIKLMKVAKGLEKLLENYDSQSEIYGKSTKTGFMDFGLEVLQKTKAGFHIALSHYYKENGDMIPDPDMEVLVNIKNKTLESLAYQDRYTYKEVYDDKFERKMVDKKEKRSQNDFLVMWLNNLNLQGHKIEFKEPYSTGEKNNSSSENKVIIVKPTVQETLSPKVEPKKAEEINTQEIMEEKKELLSDGNREKVPAKKAEIDPLLKELVSKYSNLKGKELTDKSEQITQKGTVKYLSAVIKRLETSVKNYQSQFFFVKLIVILGEKNFSKDSLLLPNLEVRIQKESKFIFELSFYESEIKKARFLIDFQTKMVRFEDDKYLPWLEKWLKTFDGSTFNEWLKDESTTSEKSAEEVIPPVISKEVHEHEDINDSIPHFELGEVQLTEAHKKRGVTQKVIDKINKTKQGVTLYPRKEEMNYNTKSIKQDLKHKAKAPGFRLSAYGKFYYEGRSNRADEGRKGF